MFGQPDRLAGGARVVQATPWGDWGDNLGNESWSGNQVGFNNAMRLLTVYGCVRFIAEGISTLPIDVFRTDGEGQKETSKPPWLSQPTADLTLIPWLTQVIISMLLDGNCYLRRVFDAQMRLVELIPMDPTKMRVTRVAGRKTYRLNGVPLDPFEVLHIPGLMMPGSDVGLSPVEMARQTIGKGMATEEHAARFFGQGMQQSGVIEDPGEVDPVKARAWARTFARLHGGLRRSHLPAVLQGGAKWVPSTVTNEQAQFLQTQQFTSSQIAALLFLIDPTELGYSPGDKGSALTYQNLEQRNIRKVEVTFLPWIVRIETAISSQLPAPRHAKFNVAGLLRADSKTRMDTYAVAAIVNQAAAVTGDKPIMLTEEMRAFEDWAPIPDSQLPTPPTPVPAPATSGGTDASN